MKHMNRTSIHMRSGMALCVLLSVLAGLGWAATLPSGFAETQIASAIPAPTAMAIAPDGRIFICEQGGRLRVVKNGSLLSTPFLTVTVSSTGERGLLGVAFDPDFATNRFVYVYYTATTPAIHNRVSRFTASASNQDVVASGSELVLLNLPNLSSATNHNGGAMHFGPDGKLYIAVGENANGPNSQTLNTTLGKMLRINKDGTIPSDNPFFNQTSGINRAIWAMGLRNPFNFTFQPGTGRMFINDVGQNTWEEINDGIRGSNYGWPTTEGPTSDPRFRAPLFAYDHSAGQCSIIGSAFYNPATQQFPSVYVGKYFFADFCAGWIRRLDPATLTVTGFATGLTSPVDLLVSPDGSLYYLVRGTGSNTGALFQVRFTQAPAISAHPQSQTVSAGQQVTFSVTAVGTAPLRYQWQRNDTNISGATSPSHTFTAAAADNSATYRCIVTNDFGSATSNRATLTVTINNPNPPTASITQPAVGALYTGGATIQFAGDGTDPQDGALPASAFTWEVFFHHDEHTHPTLPPTSGIRSGSFRADDRGHTEDNVFYRIHLTVRDSGGRTHTVTRDVLPRKATITLVTDPSGLQVTLDGQPVTTPHTFVGVAGVIRSIGAISPQSAGGQTYSFQSWSDGGAIVHEITTPAINTTYTATFENTPCVTASSGAGFLNSPITSQTGSFSVEFDATPSVSPINSTIGLSQGAQTAHTGFAALARFNPSGNIDARNGGAYAAASTIPYSAGVTYHFRMLLNLAAHTYSIFVTPAGGTERTVGSNFAFRTEQVSVPSLNSWAVWVSPTPSGSTTVCDFVVSPVQQPVCVTATSGGQWQNQSFAARSGAFTAEFDATPSASPIDSVVALSQGAQTAYTGFATLARFNPSGNIDARNGGAYAAASTIPYSAGVTYHFRLAVNVAARTYSIFVRPPGGSELTVGTNFAFRTEQSGVTSLNWWGVNVNTGIPGSSTVCNFTLSP
ncbi:MAG TPA: PQQ-dependent sugar dehydrogenase [Blastocatellia bacterium]|nr:PQQ-dependent sugar dehydrogenase [Blastocatellia bacterium]